MTKKVKYVFYNKGGMVEYGLASTHKTLVKYGLKDGWANALSEFTLTTFDELPIKLKEKLAVLMTYPEDDSNWDAEEGRCGSAYWGYVDGDD